MDLSLVEHRNVACMYTYIQPQRKWLSDSLALVRFPNQNPFCDYSAYHCPIEADWSLTRMAPMCPKANNLTLQLHADMALTWHLCHATWCKKHTPGHRCWGSMPTTTAISLMGTNSCHCHINMKVVGTGVQATHFNTTCSAQLWHPHSLICTSCKFVQMRWTMSNHIAPLN